jgi:hypothetical protein
MFAGRVIMGGSLVVVSELLVPTTVGNAASAIWTANMRARKMMVEMRTGKSRPMKEYPPDFTGYGVRELFGALFWQSLFIIVFMVGRNTPSQHFILATFYANGVPNSAIHIFS